jgi:septum formation inhibitor-activating ATPase MinD
MQKGIGLTAKEIAHFTEIPVIGIVPYDDAVAEATNKRKPLVIKDNGRAAEALRKIASKLALTK